MKAPDTVKIQLIMNDDSIIILSFVTREYGKMLPDGSYIVNWTREPSVANVTAEITKASQLWKRTVKEWRFVESQDEIPQSRAFRDAWRVDPATKKIRVDMEKAREVHRNQIRRKRIPNLVELDGQYMKADEDNDASKKKEVAQKKKYLRDFPDDPRIASANTPEELLSIWPDGVERPSQYRQTNY
jgi:hypothetical protein